MQHTHGSSASYLSMLARVPCRYLPLELDSEKIVVRLTPFGLETRFCFYKLLGISIGNGFGILKEITYWQPGLLLA